MSFYYTTKLSLGQVLSQPVVPIAFCVSLTLLSGFFFYCVYSGIAKTDKQISWILTFASSLVCTAASAPSFLAFCWSGGDMALLGSDSVWHTSLVCFFMAYLFLDLALGSVYYRNKITFLTGWFHHCMYTVILLWFLRLRISSFFSAAAMLELPTLILAIGSLCPRWRSDWLFGSTFFVLRLVLHAWMIFALKRQHRVESLWLVTAGIFPLHLYWFYGIIHIHVRKFSDVRCSPKDMDRTLSLACIAA